MPKAKDIQSQELKNIVLDSDTGARRLEGLELNITLYIALFWSIFQLWISSPLQFYLAGEISYFKNIVIDATKSRYIHLAFAMFLVFTNYPATKKSKRDTIPYSDWLFTILAVCSTLYLIVFYEQLSQRAGLANKLDVTISIIGIILLIEATRRSLGLPLAVIATIFLIYTYIGPYMPEVLIHKGHNLTKIASHQWLATEGVFGIALGVSTSFVFLFVLFGSLLEKAGAGNYFIQLAFSLLGHLKGGPAKAAVLSSGMTGLISGSSIANVVTTGTFTVPLMRKVGFSREKAGSVEVASSVNGQIMPPVMGAAAFLMVEYIGIPYVEVIKHAFIPAIISYIALLYIVHIEAEKNNMKILPKRKISGLKESLIRSGIIISSIIIISFLFYKIFSYIKLAFEGYSIYIISAILIFIYIMLLKVKAKTPDLQELSEDKEIEQLPEVGKTFKSGLHFLLPIAVLIWCLMVEKLSPGLSAFWAVLVMMIILISQKPITDHLRGGNNLSKMAKEGYRDLIDGLITGAKNMAAIGVATAAAGIVVGVVTQTGVGNKMTELVSIVAGNSILLMLIFTAFICVILGMGLPTTANYIVVSSLMATVIVELGKQNGLIIPIVAVHFFVFYFGIMADVTPPVGLASFAAAAISGGDPIRTSVQAFLYSIRTMILPFLFIFDTKMLLIGVSGLGESTFIFIKSTIAILVFTAASQGFFIIKNTLKESILLLLIAFTLFMPKFWVNKITPPYNIYNPTEIYDVVENIEQEKLRMKVKGYDLFGDEKEFYLDVTFKNLENAQRKLDEYGISIYEDDNKIFVSSVRYGSPAYKDKIELDYEIIDIRKENKQISDIWAYIPATLLLIFIYYLQRNRKKLIRA